MALSEPKNPRGRYADLKRTTNKIYQLVSNEDIGIRRGSWLSVEANSNNIFATHAMLFFFNDNWEHDWFK